MALTRRTYTAALTLLTPLLLLRHGLRQGLSPRRSPVPVRLGEVTGWASAPPQADVWIHAVSVGEVLAADALIRRLLAKASLRILVTTTTPTGASMLAKRWGDQVFRRFMPIDLPWLQRRFINAIQPRAIVVMETEIWPNMLAAAKSLGVPVILANARLSERSARRYARIRPLISPVLNEFEWIAARNELDRARFLTLGVDPRRVSVNGDIKFDITIDEDERREVAALKTAIGNRPVVILASTHAEEEAQLLLGLQALLQSHPGLLVIIAPRHPQRFDEVAALLLQSGHRIRRRSEGLPGVSTQYWLLDTLGELKRFYGLCDAAFIGGTLVPVGGHNPLEAVLWHCPVIMGEHVDNFEALSHRMQAAGILERLGDADEVIDQIRKWLGADAVARQAYAERTAAFMGKNQGATERLARRIERALNAVKPLSSPDD